MILLNSLILVDIFGMNSLAFSTYTVMLYVMTAICLKSLAIRYDNDSFYDLCEACNLSVLIH